MSPIGLISLISPILIAFLFSSIAQATNKKAGTGAAQFLKIGAGARPTAMGNSFVAMGDDVNSVYFNPAGIAEISRPEMSVMHTQWIADTDYDFGAFCYPTDLGAFAVSAATLRVDEIQRRGTDESRNGSFDAMDAAYGVTYAHNITPLVSMGLTGRFIQQKIDSTSASTWDGDVGIIKRVKGRPASFGLAVRHFGGPIKFRNESDPLPLAVDGGFSAAFMRQKLLVTGNAQWLRDNDPVFGAGAEWRQPLTENFRTALRAGYNNSATDGSGASGIAFGAGLGYKLMDFDFAWVPFGDLGNTFRYALHIKF